MELKKIIEKFALLNAALHKGKANPKAVLGKVVAEKPAAKKDMKKTFSLIDQIIQEINQLGPDEQKELLYKISPKALQEAQAPKPRVVRELPKAELGKVVTRMPPDPSKYPHLGHAVSFAINYLYAKKYKGKCILRFDDTNPEKCRAEYVKAMFSDVIEYLGLKPDKIVYESADIRKMYDVASRLIEDGNAYVCTCSIAHMRSDRLKGKTCFCRRAHNQLEAWHQMIDGKYKPGGAVLRLRGNMTAENRTLRDPVIFRISWTPHYLQGKKYRVWPLYDFASVCEEEWQKITHVLRDINFGEERIELQNWMKRLLGFRPQTFIQYGRFNLKGAVTKGRVIREMVAKKKVRGWDDPRLATMAALKRRGFVPPTFIELAKQMGLSRAQREISMETIGAVNKKFIEPVAEHYFFVPNPVVVHVNQDKIKSIKIPLIPDKTGNRILPVGHRIYIPKSDYKSGAEIRLKKLLNIKLSSKVQFRTSEVTGKAMKKGLPVVQSVSDKSIKCEILMPTGKIVKGLIEPAAGRLAEGAIVQLERFGFCRLDKKLKDHRLFVFGHK